MNVALPAPFGPILYRCRLLGEIDQGQHVVRDAARNGQVHLLAAPVGAHLVGWARAGEGRAGERYSGGKHGDSEHPAARQ